MRHRPTASQEWRLRSPPSQSHSHSQSHPSQQQDNAPAHGHAHGQGQAMASSRAHPLQQRFDPYYAPQHHPHQQQQQDEFGDSGPETSYGWPEDHAAPSSAAGEHLALNMDYNYNHTTQQQQYAPSSRIQLAQGAPSFPPPPHSYPHPSPSPFPPANPHPILLRREKKRIPLTDGHLVLDLDVPRSLRGVRIRAAGGGGAGGEGGGEGEESRVMRYTAVTDDPDDFTRRHYRLRQTHSHRRTELFICLTMYNESSSLFCRTMTSVLKNIAHFESQSRKSSSSNSNGHWGPGVSWPQIVVCIIADGRAKIDPRTLKILGLYGVYQEGVAKDEVDGRDVQAHVFEYTSQVVVDDKGNVMAGVAPVQILFCLKEQNKKKLNSHRWAFNAFCPQLRPNVCVLLDVGTRPGGTSIYALWKEFDKHKNVGGACGEITVDLGRWGRNLVNPLVAAQNFEYKMSNILDKPLESVFGFISVLPGAFSAYRYEALLGAPLEAYFLGEKMHEPGNVASLSDSNMYLAEDRILCLEIACKAKEAWTLKYVKSAKASTDVPDSVPEFISQRRRWSNGSFFASLHATLHYYRVWTSGQGFFRKLAFSLLWIYNLLQLIFQAIGLSSFYLAFFFLCSSATSGSSQDPFFGAGAEVISIANSVYIATIGVTIVCALGNKPVGSKWWYITVMVCFALLFCIALYCTAWTIWLAVPHTTAGWRNIKALLEKSGFRDIVISLGATLGLYFISSILHADPWHLITCFLQYMMFLPSYVIVLSIFAFSNLHDLAWGTKGDTSVKNLGGAKKTKGDDGKEVVELAIPTAPDDIDELWLNMRKDIATPEVVKHQKRSVDAKQADHFANIRTNTLLAYLGLNGLIVIFFSSSIWTRFLATYSTADPPVNWYNVGIFWSVAVLSAIRFTGSTLYLVFRLFGF